jgi:hypothetical protein
VVEPDEPLHKPCQSALAGATYGSVQVENPFAVPAAPGLDDEAVVGSG